MLQNPFGVSRTNMRPPYKDDRVMAESSESSFFISAFLFYHDSRLQAVVEEVAPSGKGTRNNQPTAAELKDQGSEVIGVWFL